MIGLHRTELKSKKFPDLPLARKVSLEVGVGLRVRDERDREPVAPLGRTLKKKKKKVLSGLEKEAGLGLKGVGL